MVYQVQMMYTRYSWNISYQVQLEHTWNSCSIPGTIEVASIPACWFCAGSSPESAPFHVGLLRRAPVLLFILVPDAHIASASNSLSQKGAKNGFMMFTNSNQ